MTDPMSYVQVGGVVAITVAFLKYLSTLDKDRAAERKDRAEERKSFLATIEKSNQTMDRMVDWCKVHRGKGVGAD